MNRILKVHATRTDCAGNGYYRASDGYYYYGNTQNGYLVETEETKRLKAEKAAQNTSYQQTGSMASSAGNPSAGNPLLDMLAVKAGTKFGELLGVIIFTVLPFLFKLCLVFGMLPALALDYLRDFIIYGNGFLYKLLSTCGLLAIMALIVYGVYRKMKQQKSIAKPVFFGEALCLTGICYLNTRGDGTGIAECILLSVLAAYATKVCSAWLEKIVYNIWKKVSVKNR